MMPRRSCPLGFLLTFSIVLAGCPTPSKPDGTGAPDTHTAAPELHMPGSDDGAPAAASNETGGADAGSLSRADAMLPAPTADGVSSNPLAEEPDGASPSDTRHAGRSLPRPAADEQDAKPRATRSWRTFGPIRRAARFQGATTPPVGTGVQPGEPFVAIVAPVERGALHPGSEGATFKIECFLGPMPLWPIGGTGGAYILVSRDPGGDLGELPVFCVELPVVGRLLGKTAKEIIDDARLAAIKNPELARWLRGPDGRGPAPPTIKVAPRQPDEPFGSDVGRWLDGKLGQTP